MKESTVFICRVPSRENGQLMLERPELPHGFQGSVFFKATFEVKVADYGLSSDWLVVR